MSENTRWERVETAFHAILAAEPKDRPALLAAQPEEIREEVAGLVEVAESPDYDRFLERPAFNSDFFNRLMSKIL